MLVKKVRLAAVVGVVCGVAGGRLTAQELRNGGFEEVSDRGAVQGWHAVGSFVCDTAQAHGGARSIRCEVPQGGANGRGGVMQEIVYDRPDTAPIVFGGWSRAEGVMAAEYCIYLDIWYAGGGNAWGVTASWSQPTHDWEYTAEVFYPEKPVQKIQVFVFLRNGSGRVWFDDLTLERRVPALGIKSMRLFTDVPRTADGVVVNLAFWKRAQWQCRVLERGEERARFAGDGMSAAFGATGGPGRALAVTARAGDERFEQTVPLPAIPLARANPVPRGCAVWTADAMRHVTPLTCPTASELAAPEIALDLARRECESAQLLVTAADSAAVSNVTVTVTALTGDAGRRFDGEVAWQRVGYIRRQRPYHAHPCGAPAEENWLPDPLLPAAPFTVRAAATQGVWLTARAAPDAAPGVYRGQITVSAEGLPVRILPISVRVRAFANPATFGLPTAFCVMDGFTRAQYPERFEEMKRKTHDLMLSHRLNPDDISRTEPPRIDDLLHARERGMNRFNILNLVPKPARPGKWVCYAPLEAYMPAFYDELKARLTPYVAELRRHGLENYAYLYGFDERTHDYYPAIAELWRALKRDFPDIPVMTTAMMYRDMRDGKNHPEQDITDWFCPLTSVYDPELSARLRAQGRQVWWYVCCGPTWPHANFASFEYPPVEGRLLGWLTHRYRSDGLLFWHVNLWPDRPPLQTGDTYLDEWVAEYSLKMPGDGQLLYPGADGPLPSIRLAQVRDGIEDYEWLQMLERRAGRAAAEAMTGELIRGMTDFTRDPAALRRVRVRIADALDRP
ncbi:MAG: glycoside hydrolase domain-containing protein [Kiritimatiellia bacterium]